MEVKMEDIPDKMVALVEIIGMDNFVEITRIYGGDILYIPSYKSLKKQVRNRKIKTEYDGFNSKELSKNYDLSVSQINRIIRVKI